MPGGPQIGCREALRESVVHRLQQIACALGVTPSPLQSREAGRGPQLPGRDRLSARDIQSAAKMARCQRTRVAGALLNEELALDTQQFRQTPPLLTALRPLDRLVDGLERLRDFPGVSHGAGECAEKPEVARQRTDLRSFREH